MANLGPAPTDRAATRGKGLNIALWVVQALLAFALFGAGASKLAGAEKMIALYDAIGVGQWFRYVTGVLEIAGAVMIVVPRTKAVGAALLATIMVGAIATHLAILHNSPAPPTVLLALAAFVVWGRRADLARLIAR